MGIDIVNTLSEDEWRHFVEEHPQSNIFHTPEMFQVFERVQGHQPILWAAVDGHNCPLALLLPVNIALMNGLLRPFTTRAVAYGSALCAPSPEGKEAMTTLLRTYQQKTKGSVLFTELRNLSDLRDVQAMLNECGFVYEKHLNYLIDLNQPEKTIWSKISKSGQQSVRTSRNKGTRIEEATERQQAKIAYRLLQKVYARAQVPLASPTLFEAAFDILAPREMFKIFLARANNDYIGACLLLIHKGRIIDWYAGTDRSFSSYCPMELLIWHTLQWGREHGSCVFDFGGAGKPDEDYGPRKFKAKFGGELVEFGRNTYVHSKLRLQLSRLGYRLYRQFL